MTSPDPHTSTPPYGAWPPPHPDDNEPIHVENLRD